MLDFVFENNPINNRPFNSAKEASTGRSTTASAKERAGSPGSMGINAGTIDISRLIAERLERMMNI
jgi:hypothetical protein